MDAWFCCVVVACTPCIELQPGEVKGAEKVDLHVGHHASIDASGQLPRDICR